MRQLFLIAFTAFIFTFGCKEEVVDTTANVVESENSPFEVFEGSPSQKVLPIQGLDEFLKGFQVGVSASSQDALIEIGLPTSVPSNYTQSYVLLGCHNPPCKVEMYLKQGNKKSSVCRAMHTNYHNVIYINKGMTCSSTVEDIHGGYHCKICDELNDEGVCQTFEKDSDGEDVLKDMEIPFTSFWCLSAYQRTIDPYQNYRQISFIKGVDTQSPIFFHTKIIDREGETREGSIEIRWN